MVRVAQIASGCLENDSDDVVRTLSMSSMAGTTVARLGVPREKNSVASLKTYAEQHKQAKEETENSYSP